MPSTYTVNLGIEKPATGEQSGTWGDTTNVNFDILDQAINGAVRVTLTSAGSSGSPNALQITNGATSDGRNKWVEFYSSGDLGGSAYVQLDPNDAEKIVFVRNSLASSRSVILFQGTYNSARDLEVPAGVDMVVKFDGGGASAATVTDVYTKLRVTELTTPTLTATTADINGGTLDNSVIGGTTAAAITGTTIVANTSLNIAGDGATVTGIKDEDNMASNSATKLATQQSIKAYVDSQVGTVDTLAEILANGNTSGSNNLIINNGQALTSNTINETTAGSGVTIDSVLLKDDVVNATDVETSNISANDGTAAASIANSTGNFTITNFISNSVDIGGGAIDGTPIGSTSATSGAFTTLTASGDVTVDTDTLKVDSTNDRVGVNTSSMNVDFQVGNQNDSSDRAIAIASGGSNSKSLIFRRSTSDDFVIVEDSSENLSINGLAGKEIVINNTSLDLDFRVESDGNANMLFVDAGNDHVNIGTSTDLGEVLNVSGGIAATDNTGSTVKFQWSAASERLTLKTSGAFALDVQASATTSATMAQFSNSNGSDKAYIALDSTGSGKLVLLDGGNNEDVLIQASGTSYYNTGGNFLIGKSSADLSVAGIELRDVGLLTATRASESPLYVRRLTDSGNLINLLKDSTSVGSIGVNNGVNLYIGSDGETGLKFGSTDIVPADAGSDGASSDADMNLGNSSTRFKRIFLSDGVQDSGSAGSATVFNDGATTADFRVESDNNANMIFVDAGNNAVGIGASVPQAPLQVQKALASDGAIIIARNDRTRASGVKYGLEFRDSTNEANAVIQIEQTGSNNQARMIFQTNNATGGNGIDNGVESLRLFPTENVFNEDSADQDFRVESNSNSHMLFVDAGNDFVGINKGTPEAVLHVKSASSGTVTTFESSSANNSAGPNIRLWRNSASPADGDALARLIFQGNNDAAERIDFVEIQTEIVDASDGTEDGQLDIQTMTAGVSRTRLRLNGTESIFNDGGRDIDFRVESDNIAGMLFVDAGNDAVGIGGTGITSTATLSVIGQTEITAGDGYDFNVALMPDLSLSIAQGKGTGILFMSEDSGSSARHAAAIQSHRISTSASNYNNGLRFSVRPNNLEMREVLQLNPAEAVFNENSNDVDFRVESNNDTHCLYVDAGNDRVLVGRVSAASGNDFVSFDANPGSTGQLIQCGRDDTSTKNHVIFTNPNGTVGSIQTAGSATSYNTSSDARLKENIADADDAGELVDAIQVRKFDWIADGEHQRYGMVAQELNTVAPEAVSEGETEEDMMGVDYSKLVPMLIKEIQSLRARVAQLENT